MEAMEKHVCVSGGGVLAHACLWSFWGRESCCVFQNWSDWVAIIVTIKLSEEFNELLCKPWLTRGNLLWSYSRIGNIVGLSFVACVVKWHFSRYWTGGFWAAASHLSRRGTAGRALLLLKWPYGEEAESLCSGVLLAWVGTLARPLPSQVTLGKSLSQFGSQFAHL